MNLSKASNDDLRKEIERRKIAMLKPKLLLHYPDGVELDKIRKLCKQYIDSLAGDCYFKDAEYHIFEAAITLFYGKDVWTWINERIK